MANARICTTPPTDSYGPVYQSRLPASSGLATRPDEIAGEKHLGAAIYESLSLWERLVLMDPVRNLGRDWAHFNSHSTCKKSIVNVAEFLC